MPLETQVLANITIMRMFRANFLRAAIIIASVVAAVAVGIVVAPQFSKSFVVLAGLLAGCTAGSAGLLVLELLEGTPFQVETHWGGLGGGLSGWRVSAPVLYFVLTIVFASLLLATMLLYDPPKSWSATVPSGVPNPTAVNTPTTNTPKGK